MVQSLLIIRDKLDALQWSTLLKYVKAVAMGGEADPNAKETVVTALQHEQLSTRKVIRAVEATERLIEAVITKDDAFWPAVRFRLQSLNFN